MVGGCLALGCAPRHPTFRALPDGGALTPVDVDEGRDAPEAGDLGAADDGPTPMEDDRPTVDAGLADDAAMMDVPVDVPADVPADVAVDVAVDAPIDVAVDVVVVDVRADVGVDVPRADVGAPDRWRLVASDVVYTPWRSATPIGTTIFRRECGDGQVLVGLTTWASEYVSGIAGRCARLDSDGTTGTTALGSRVGATYNTTQDDSCPSGQVIVRIGGASGAVVERLQEACAPIATWLTTGALGAVLRRHGDGTGGAPFEDTCPAGYVGAGFEASVRNNFDLFRDRVGALRLRCVRLVGETD